MSTKKVLLVIMDGWGLGQVPSADAIAQANTPIVDGLYAQYPHATLVTHSEQVGLPDGQMGNSEVGHLNIGAGRVVYQELARINKAVREHELNHNPVLLDAIKYAKDNGKPLHIMGLVSDGGVHSHINHLKGLIDIVEEQGLTEAYIHAFTDGRDCDPKSGLGFLQEIVEYTANKATKLASVVGRYYAMDRDKRWERVKLAYDAMVNGIGELDVVVNCAGVIQRSLELEAEAFARTIDINLNGTMRVCAAAREGLKARRGCIVNTASMLSFFGGGLVPGYSASKGGVAQLTKSLAIAYADDGIRVNAVAPGWIATPLTQALQDDPQRAAPILARTPMKRWGTPADIAGPVMFLASAQAQFVTGVILPVDGGYLIS
jgi:NAD(P)-dependent dehydrogenase (short-subunit alcohol dehydrogenase family)